MKTKRTLLLLGCTLAAFALFGCATIAPAKQGPPSLQLLVVTTADWVSSEARLQRYERQAADSAWVAQGEPLAAMVGRNGLAWGTGRHPETAAAAGPKKREGDGKAPAGIFALGPSFGEAEGSALPWLRLSYEQMTDQHRCVDDVNSPFYNRLVDERVVAKGWQSDEEMRRKDGLYRLGLVVHHNLDPVVPGGGSCIFLHIWQGPGQGTSGCTALDASAVEEVLGWLRPDAQPLLVQLPREEYDRLRGPWGLP
ncbi:MAG: hypothetical protein M0009_10300 [Deltaproteobacteria bacterium]|nr:hypothetical protein [Deltaproteobacteria bacterium]